MLVSEPMETRYIALMIMLFFLILAGFRFGWIFYHQPADHPQAENGFIDLSD